MKKQQHFIEVNRTAEYYTLEPEVDEVKKLMFVLHGYSQLPEYFIGNFKSLTNLGFCVVAPSGLSLSYQSGFNGRVGASWMTKHNRLNEIKDYVAYLDQLYVELKQKYPNAETVSVLGFSQGAATASRWFASGESRLDQLILCAGYLAEDVDFTSMRKKIGNGKIAFFAGREDSYMDAERVELHKNFLNEHQLPFVIYQFDGGHEIPKNLVFEFCAADISQNSAS